MVNLVNCPEKGGEAVEDGLNPVFLGMKDNDFPVRVDFSEQERVVFNSGLNRDTFTGLLT